MMGSITSIRTKRWREAFGNTVSGAVERLSDFLACCVSQVRTMLERTEQSPGESSLILRVLPHSIRPRTLGTDWWIYSILWTKAGVRNRDRP